MAQEETGLAIVEESPYAVMRQQATDAAVLAGFSVVTGTPRTLLLDLDDSESIARYERMSGMVSTFVEFKSSESWASKSGVGRHVVIEIEQDLPVVERLLLQLVLGSDPTKEFLSLVTRLWNGDQEPSVLFRPPTKLIQEK